MAKKKSLNLSPVQVVVVVVLLLIAYLYGISSKTGSPIQEPVYVPTSAVYAPTSFPMPSVALDSFNETSIPTTAPATRTVTCSEPDCPQECRGQSIIVESSYRRSFACCELSGKHKLMKIEDCQLVRSSNQGSTTSGEKVLVTLPHNGKQMRCVKGYDTSVYNFSLKIKNDLEQLKTQLESHPDTYNELKADSDRIFNEYAKQYCD